MKRVTGSQCSFTFRNSEGSNGSFNHLISCLKVFYHSPTWQGIHLETSDKWESKKMMDTNQTTLFYPLPTPSSPPSTFVDGLPIQFSDSTKSLSHLPFQTLWSHMMPLKFKSHRLNPSSTHWPTPHAWPPCSYTVVQSYSHTQRMLNLYDWETEKS